MAFNSKAGSRISKSQMMEMTGRYEKSDQRTFDTLSVYFGKETFERLLSIPGAVGVRVHYGLDRTELELHPIFTPVDASGKDIHEVDGASVVEEVGAPCPPNCLDQD